jgi:hypothetical protein
MCLKLILSTARIPVVSAERRDEGADDDVIPHRRRSDAEHKRGCDYPESEDGRRVGDKTIHFLVRGGQVPGVATRERDV